MKIPVKQIGITRRKLPRALVPFFFLNYFFFGLDLGYAVNFGPKYRSLFKVISTVVSFIMMALLMTLRLNYADFYWLFWICEYIMYFIILKTIRYSPCDFLQNLHLPSGQVIGLGRVVNISTFLSLIFNIFVSFIRCLDNKFKTHEGKTHHGTYFLRIWPVFSLELVSVALCIIFQCTRLKLKNLRSDLKDSHLSPNLFLQQYAKLADSYDDIKPFINSVVITNLVIGVPKFMSLLWHKLLILKITNLSWSSHLRNVVSPMHMILQICLPAFVAETINTEIDDIKVVLTEKVGTGRREKRTRMSCFMDDFQSEDVERVVQYLEHRHLRHEIFRVVPLDMRLPILLFSLCSTYFIVFLQFTHFYD